MSGQIYPLKGGILYLTFDISPNPLGSQKVIIDPHEKERAF
jgi:hypothetical protein